MRACIEVLSDLGEQSAYVHMLVVAPWVCHRANDGMQGVV